MIPSGDEESQARREDCDPPGEAIRRPEGEEGQIGTTPPWRDCDSLARRHETF